MLKTYNNFLSSYCRSFCLRSSFLVDIIQSQHAQGYITYISVLSSFYTSVVREDAFWCKVLLTVCLWDSVNKWLAVFFVPGCKWLRFFVVCKRITSWSVRLSNLLCYTLECVGLCKQTTHGIIGTLLLLYINVVYIHYIFSLW